MMPKPAKVTDPLRERFASYLFDKLFDYMSIDDDQYGYSKYVQLCRITLILIRLTKSKGRPLSCDVVAVLKEKTYHSRTSKDQCGIYETLSSEEDNPVAKFTITYTHKALEKIMRLKRKLPAKYTLKKNKHIFAKKRTYGPISGTRAMLRFMSHFLSPVVDFDEVLGIL